MIRELNGHRRLPPGTRPAGYELFLDLDPERDRFAGEVTITLRVARPTSRLHLHAERLEVQGVEVRAAGLEVPARVLTGPHGALCLELPRAVAGDVTVHLRFDGPLDEVPDGLYRVREGECWYIYTQFEPLSARRCFPCFDEPAFKAPFRVRLRAPENCVALANSRLISSTPLAGGVEHTFAPTPPLATYLVAFAVGPFEVVSAPADAVPGVPLRVITSRGRSHLAGLALEYTQRILGILTAWFGQPYPYDKLDLVGVPNFAAGAMENVGLVTFRERLLLLDAERAPANDRLWAQVVIAHELAHMWFGNLVTMSWWDDLWLNEAFATWMEMACVAEADPSLDAALEAVHEGLRVMDHDALVEARAIRQAVHDGGDVLNAFDGITYSKGAAVVRMTEAWLGSATFRDGVRRYLVTHAHGNAETADLLMALAHVSGQPVRETLVTFLDQPGVPIVDVSLGQDPDGQPLLLLSQRRYLPEPGRARPGSSERWHVPVTVRLGNADGEITRIQHLLTEREAQVPLSTPSLPTWLHPNAGEAGYYRWSLADADLGALLDTGFPHLTLAERVGLPEHLWALLESDRLPVAAYLAALLTLSAEPHRLVIAGIAAALRRLSRVAEPGPFARFVGRILSPHLARIGPLPQPGDSSAARLLRPVLVTALADADADLALETEVISAALPLLACLPQADPELLQMALPIAAWRGNAALQEALVDALTQVPTPAHRSAVLSALGSFGDPALVDTALDHFLTDIMRAQDVFQLLRGAGRQDATQARMWAWLDRHYDAVAAKIGDEAAAHLPSLGSGFRDAAGRAAVESFFADPARRKPGTERNLRQVLEDIDRRIRLHRRLSAPLAAALDALTPANPDARAGAPT